MVTGLKMAWIRYGYIFLTRETRHYSMNYMVCSVHMTATNMQCLCGKIEDKTQHSKKSGLV